MLIMLHGACAWHRMAVCSAHGYAGSIASPGGGALPFWACSTAPARMAVAAATGAVAWALLAMACGRRSASGAVFSLLPAPHSASRTRSRPPPSVSQRVHVCVAYIMGLHAGLGCCACTSLPCSTGPSALKSKTWEPCVQKQSRRARGSAVYSELKIKQNCALGPQNPYFFRCAPNHGGHAAGARRQSDISHMAHLVLRLLGF